MMSDHRAFMETENNYLGVLTYHILRSYPNLTGFYIQEEFSGGSIKPVDDLMSSGIRVNNLKELTISMMGHKNYSFYHKLLNLTKDNIRKLRLGVEGDSFRTQGAESKKKATLFEAVEGSISITSIKVKSDFYLLSKEIQVLATLPNLMKLQVDWFDADAMQELLEREFTKGLKNLTHLQLLFSVPHPEKAFKGIHKSLIHLKYAYTQRQKDNKLNLDQTLAIVEGKKFGFKFTTLFENDKEFQMQCPKAVLLDPSHNWYQYKK
ncbi:hypothetical protein FGO68_gene12651 [Halteria grandinella]|uniref:Uncharacterized protein n=1 Tax=Halteria grandinella TaxID=5974 RepID=A0A8J8NWF2_HALGN|nr:hypothetical protein FGO68_gene12651 [Halteria grandinella]